MRILVYALLCALAISCNQKTTEYRSLFKDPLLYSKTVKQLNDIVLENNFPPMIASRNYAYATIAAYECIAAGDTTYPSLAGRIKHMPVMPIPADPGKIDFSLSALLAFIKVGNAVTFPEGSMMKQYDQVLHDADSLDVPNSIIQASAVFADSISSAILKWSKGDSYAATRGASRYSVNDSTGRWVPTPPMYASGLEPHWREIRPFVLDSASQCKPGRPPVFSMDKNSSYFQSMMEVKNTVDHLSDEQKHIADFWDDNPFKMNVTVTCDVCNEEIFSVGALDEYCGDCFKKCKRRFCQDGLRLCTHSHRII